ncbi:MAG: sugar phosphate isomerase/epimerase [Chthoniobacterales bacterium]|nr:sugar phosphate isomerase/epimerase [Chthoniobacterales bacterium]
MNSDLYPPITPPAGPAQFLIPLPWQTRHQQVEFAAAQELGLEVLAFCSGPALNSPQVRRERSAELQKQLRGYEYPLTFHGAFIDIALHSSDDSIAAASRARIERDLTTACELGCTKAVFHTGFNPNVSVPQYPEEVVEGHSAFWADVITRFPEIVICLENTYEPDAAVLQRIVRNVDSNRCSVCLDVAHAHVFGAETPERWFGPLAPWIAHMHWNDNMGASDNHLPIGDGLIRWPKIWERTQELPQAVTITLELGSLHAIRRSLLQLERLGIWQPRAFVSAAA